VVLDLLNGDLSTVEDTGCKSSLAARALKHLCEVLHVPCTAGRDDRNGDERSQIRQQITVEAILLPIRVDQIDLASTVRAVIRCENKDCDDAFSMH